MLKEQPARSSANFPSTSWSVPCTCGELFQGSLDGEACLVSCPIDLYSTAVWLPAERKSKPLGEKVRLALDAFMQSASDHSALSITTPLPPGRGYGTSTADIGAALFALSSRNGIPLDGEEAASIAVGVEPSDSTPFEGLTLFAHKNAAFQRRLGNAPEAKVLVLDPGGSVDTQRFNAHDWSPQLKKLAADHRVAFDLLEDGITRRDLSAIGEAATRSARLHQEIMHNPLLEQALAVAEQIHAHGVCRAHSGTVLGLILDIQRQDDEDLIEFCRKRFPSTVQFRMTTMVDGGVRIRHAKDIPMEKELRL
jgi:L-threonine kinase